MSRHLYDLEKMMNTNICRKALINKQLYNSIVEHRRMFIGLKDFDYSTLNSKTINIIPPEYLINKWKEDYETMQTDMIYGDSLTFDNLIDKIKLLNNEINNITW